MFDTLTLDGRAGGTVYVVFVEGKEEESIK